MTYNGCTYLLHLLLHILCLPLQLLHLNMDVV